MERWNISFCIWTKNEGRQPRMAFVADCFNSSLKSPRAERWFNRFWGEYISFRLNLKCLSESTDKESISSWWTLFFSVMIHSFCSCFLYSSRGSCIPFIRFAKDFWFSNLFFINFPADPSGIEDSFGCWYFKWCFLWLFAPFYSFAMNLWGSHKFLYSTSLEWNHSRFPLFAFLFVF